MSTFSVVLIALLTLAIGIVLGALLWRKLGPHSHQNRELEAKLKEAEQRLSSYQTEVAEHFLETSRRVNELTRSYKEVHEYLASSAMKLTTPSLSREIKTATQISWADEPTEHELATDSEQHEADSLELEQKAEPEVMPKDRL